MHRQHGLVATRAAMRRDDKRCVAMTNKQNNTYESIALDAIEIGVIGVGYDGNLDYMNSLAERILGFPTLGVAGEAFAHFHNGNHVLANAVRTAMSSGANISVALGSGCFATVVPLRGPGPGASAQGCVVLVSAVDRRVASVSQLTQLFGMTVSEARLARGLAQGKTVESYASDNGLSLATVRTHLRSVLAKTGVKRQIDLIRILHAILPVRD